MRKLLAPLLLAAALALPVSSAQASFHLQKVNEVMLASGAGNTHVQFVELFDNGGSEESFPVFFGPYKLVVYNAAGTKLGSQLLNGSGMAAASSAARPYLISTQAADTALGVKGDEPLTVALPRPAGQACYTAGSSETAYSCITWGCITHAVDASAGTGSAHGAVPPNGKSTQRQPAGGVQIAAPTPGKANRAGTRPPACPFSGVRIKDQTVTVKNGKAPVAVKCPATAKGNCVGTVHLRTEHAVTNASGQKHVIDMGKQSFTIKPGVGAKVQVPLTAEGKGALAKHGTLKTIATVAAHDSRGTTKVTSAHVTLN